MKKIYEPHEPLEQVLSAEDAFKDAEQSESRWQTNELDQKRHRLLVELPD
jgi:hypothetical protein